MYNTGKRVTGCISIGILYNYIIQTINYCYHTQTKSHHVSHFTSKFNTVSVLRVLSFIMWMHGDFINQIISWWFCHITTQFSLNPPTVLILPYQTHDVHVLPLIRRQRAVATVRKVVISVTAHVLVYYVYEKQVLTLLLQSEFSCFVFPHGVPLQVRWEGPNQCHRLCLTCSHSSKRSSKIPTSGFVSVSFTAPSPPPRYSSVSFKSCDSHPLKHSLRALIRNHT